MRILCRFWRSLQHTDCAYPPSEPTGPEHQFPGPLPLVRRPWTVWSEPGDRPGPRWNGSATPPERPSMTTLQHETATEPNTDERIVGYTPLPTPAVLRADLPADGVARAAVARARDEVRAVLAGVDDRLLVIVGPCSIHDTAAGLDYARRLARAAARHRGELLVVMRTYFEKPRTTIGWKGLVNDPGLDGSHDMEAGLRAARRFLLDVTALGLPAATEFLEPVAPQYLADLLAWGAIGARTAESQIHRQLVSGLSMPVGFKNGTDGGLQVALDACTAASVGQAFLGMDPHGQASMVRTQGNPDVHLVLRGGAAGPNYGDPDLAAA